MKFLDIRVFLAWNYEFKDCYLKSEILPEMIEWGPLCITDLFQNKSVAYFNPK